MERDEDPKCGASEVTQSKAVFYSTAGNELGFLKLERTNDSKALIIAAARLDRETIAKLLITVKCFKYGSTPKLNKYYNKLVSKKKIWQTLTRLKNTRFFFGNVLIF